MLQFSLLSREERANLPINPQQLSPEDLSKNLNDLYDLTLSPNLTQIMYALNMPTTNIAATTEGEISEPAPSSNNPLSPLTLIGWQLLTLICDQCDVSTEEGTKAFLYIWAEELMNDSAINFEQRRNAFYFLKSQGQHDLLSRNNDLVSLVINKQEVAAWVEHCSADKARLIEDIQFLFNCSSTEIKIYLIELALTGQYKLEVLEKALATYEPTEEEIREMGIYSVFFLKKIIEKPESSNYLEIISTALEALSGLNARFPLKIHDLFMIFVEPVLKQNAQYLIDISRLIADKYPFLLQTFSTLASFTPMTVETSSVLANQALALVKCWDFDEKFTQKIEKEHGSKFNSYSETTQKDITNDLKKNVVRELVAPLVNILTLPNIWDTLIALHGTEFTNHLEGILTHDTKDFFRYITSLPWDSTGKRICSDKTIDWLFSLSCMSTLKFIQPDDPHFSSNGLQYLTALITHNDSYVIKKLYEANSASEFTLFKGLTKLSNYAEIKPIIIDLLIRPDFHIEIYYPQASEQFKQLPQVKTAIQLYHFFRSEDVSASNDNDFFTEIFFHGLINHYAEDVKTMTEELSRVISSGATASETNNALIQKAFKLHEKIKRLSMENKQILNQDLRFVSFALAYRILANIQVDEPTNTQQQSATSLLNFAARTFKKAATQTMKGHVLVGKAVKTPFLLSILNHLLNFGGCSSINTPYPEAPFIWSIYITYVQQKRAMQNQPITEEDCTYSQEKMIKVNIWLNEQILETANAKETEAIALLPSEIRTSIFNGATLTSVPLERLDAIHLQLSRQEEEEARLLREESQTADFLPPSGLVNALSTNSLFREQQTPSHGHRPIGGRFNPNSFSLSPAGGGGGGPGRGTL